MVVKSTRLVTFVLVLWWHTSRHLYTFLYRITYVFFRFEKCPFFISDATKRHSPALAETFWICKFWDLFLHNSHSSLSKKHSYIFWLFWANFTKIRQLFWFDKQLAASQFFQMLLAQIQIISAETLFPADISLHPYFLKEKKNQKSYLPTTRSNSWCIFSCTWG